MEYKAEGLYNSEEEAKAGLDTCGYAEKWKKAQWVIKEGNPDLAEPAYWDTVRLCFLELGGEWIAEKKDEQTKPSIKLGSIVRLRSDGPHMTVTHVDEETGAVHCHFWNSERARYSGFKDLPTECLILVE